MLQEGTWRWGPREALTGLRCIRALPSREGAEVASPAGTGTSGGRAVGDRHNRCAITSAAFRGERAAGAKVSRAPRAPSWGSATPWGSKSHFKRGRWPLKAAEAMEGRYVCQNWRQERASTERGRTPLHRGPGFPCWPGHVLGPSLTGRLLGFQPSREKAPRERVSTQDERASEKHASAGALHRQGRGRWRESGAGPSRSWRPLPGGPSAWSTSSLSARPSSRQRHPRPIFRTF